jgi:hypothetical protein
MGVSCENDRERLEAGTSVPARDGSEAVSQLTPIKLASVYEFSPYDWIGIFLTSCLASGGFGR